MCTFKPNLTKSQTRLRSNSPFGAISPASNNVVPRFGGKEKSVGRNLNTSRSTNVFEGAYISNAESD